MDNKLNNLLDDTMNDKNDAYQQMLNSIKSTSPVYKLNIDKTNPQYALGVYLMSLKPEEIDDLLREKAVMDDLRDDTILFFEARHIMELVNIINGLLDPAVAAKVIPQSTVKIKINKIIETLSVPTYYDTFKAFIDKFCNRLILLNSIPEWYTARVKTVFQYIWFIPYMSLDELLAVAIETFQKANSGNDING